MRLPEQIATDRVLLLYLMAGCNRSGAVDGRTKLQKLTFLSEAKLMEREIDALHYKFFRYQFGPFSKDLLNDYEDLYEKDFVSSNFTLKERADYLLDYVSDELRAYKNNKNVFETIDSVCQTYAKLSRQRLVEVVYAMRMEPNGMHGQMKIESMPAFTDILVPERFKGKSKFEIPTSLREDIQSELSGDILTPAEAKKVVSEAEQSLIAKIRERVGPKEKEDFVKRMKREGVSQPAIDRVFQN